MPGIVGIIGLGRREENMSELRRMVKCMMHEPFYTSGVYVNEPLGLWIGWVAHEGTFSDCMPIWNETKEMCVIFSGETIMDLGEIDRLRAGGHECDTENASYLVHLYEELGLKFAEELNGWFSGLVLDIRKKSVALFNDRYGMNRMFIHEDKDRFYFSSEAKALLTVLPQEREFDKKGLGEFLSCGCTLESRSLYRGINILPPRSLWTFAGGKVETRGSYFEPGQWVGQESMDEKYFLPQVIDLLGGLVRKYSRGLLPFGVSLTGGLDSRMIMACLDVKAGEFPCYTFGSTYRDTFDVKVAREVAQLCGQPHQVLTLGEEFLCELPRHLERAIYISDGYIGLSGAAELYLNAVARDLAPVRLTGNYGGELLRGVRAFKYQEPKGAFINPDMESYLVEARSTFQKLETVDPLTFSLFTQAPSQGYGRRAIENSQMVTRTPFMDNSLVKLAYQAPPHLLRGIELSVAIISRYNPSLLQIPTDRGLLGFGSRLEGASRQLHRRVLIKAEYFSSHGMPGWLAAITRFGLGGVLEKNFLGRDKFQHFRLWTQKRCAGYIMEVLLQPGRELEAFFNQRRIESMVNEHVAGRQNYTEELDKLLTLVLAHRFFLKNVSFGL